MGGVSVCLEVGDGSVKRSDKIFQILLRLLIFVVF